MPLLRKKRIIVFSLIIILFGLFLFFTQVQAGTLDVGINYATATGLGTQDIRVTIANIIRVILGLLGIVAVALVIYGGYLYMTAEGIPEKIERAKKLLISAVIGLVIVLSAFAIASFILSRLVESTGGVVTQPVCGNGSCEFGEDSNNCPSDCGVPIPPPPPPSTYCSDPTGDTFPWLCIDPNSDLRDAGITVTAGNIGDTPGSIYFRDKDGQKFPAEILKCNDTDSDWFQPISNSDLSRIVIKVPQALTLSGNDYNVVAETSDGFSTFDKDWGISQRQDIFTLAGESLSNDPILICLIDENNNEIYSAKANDTRILKGQRFGNISGTVTYNNVIASINDWGENTASTLVPLASSGFVKLRTETGAISNGLWTDIICDTGDECITGCCISNSCQDSQYCAPYIGQSCDSDNNTPTCEAGACYPGLECDLTNCTCQQPVVPGPGEGCDTDPNLAACQEGQCAEGLYCSTNENCTCQYLPQIDDVIPDNGAPGNYVTLVGHGFGTTLGQVIFLGDEADPGDDVQAILPVGCGSSNIWQDNQVIIEIPDGAVDGPLKLINSDNLEETTSDNDGAVVDFDVNTITRPSICNLNPTQGEFGQSVTITGKNFGQTISQALIGGINFNNKANWSWLDTEISNLLVPNIEPATLPVQVQTLDASGNPINSNYYNFEVLPSATAPKIDYLDPDFGPTGQYITIFGSNFGQDTGIVRFLDVAGETDFSQWLAADTNFSQDCSNAFWHDNYIVVKVPQGALTDSKIVIETSDGLFSNAIDFNHCNQDPNSCPLSPGICKIVPDQGPVGTTDITLYGENFGTYQSGQSNITFWANKNVSDNLANYWTDNKIGSGQTAAGLPITVPLDAETGPVQLVDEFGNKSNQIQFEVKDCRDDSTICSSGLICCQTDGVCKLDSQCASVTAQLCNYSWGFTTGEATGVLAPPQVIEDIQCNDNTQSPTPWKDSTDNCINIWVSARFNKSMNTSSLNTGNILVQNCGTTAGFDENNCLPQLVSALEVSPIDDIGFVFKPAQNLQPNTWYKVTLKSGASGIKSAQGVMLDGDFDSIEGGDYSWSFKTRNSTQACDIDKVVVNPQDATIETLSKSQAYNAFALADNCNILDSDAYDWNWYKVYSDGHQEAAGALDNNYGVALVSEEDVLPVVGGVVGNGNVDYKQTASPVKQGLVYVGASASDKKDEDNRLVVDLNIPVINRIYPDNGLIDPAVNSYVTIYGKNFGENPNATQVLFEDVPASLSDCPNSWSDTMIQVKVPKSIQVTREETPTYNLPQPAEESGMVLFYDIEGTSNVILSDKVGNYDGEIKGAQRVSDQFGQALLFNGISDYIKLPNNLNLSTGSLEFWFKPAGGGRQTLFSASDGSADNLLAIDYDSVTNNLYLDINNAAGNISNSLSASIVKLNQWNHFVYTFDGSQYVFYINGQKFYDIPVTASVFALTNLSTKGFLNDIAGKTDILIGATDNQGLQNFYQGSFDNFAIYNKVLTADDVNRDYGLSIGQALLLNFEGSGSEIIDSSANNFKNVTIADASKNFRIDQGKYGKAINFNNDNHLNINNDPSFVFDKGITVEGWFKTSDLNSKTIFEANNISLGISNQCNGTNFCFRALIADEENPANSGFKYAALPLDAIKLNDWNYFAGVYDGENIKIYLNGQKQEYGIKGSIYQNNNFNSACLGGCTNNFSGALDEIAIYNQALADSDIFSRVGAKNNSHIIVKTIGGQATSDQTFKYSDNIYPFLCSLAPNSGLQGTEVSLNGDNFGDSNKTIFQGVQYGVGSYNWFNNTVIEMGNISSWTNMLVKAINPFSDVGQAEIPVSISIDPYSEPYNDLGKSGSYVQGVDNFADSNGNGSYDPGTYQVEDFETGQTVTLDSLSSNALPFYLSPVITSISPDNGPQSQWVTINGYNFGDEHGEVYFYNEQLAELAPCSVKWTNNYIIAIVPPGADSGNVYIKTAKGLESNRVQFTVNNNPVGPGLCDVYTLTNDGQHSHNGRNGDQVFAEGDNFGDSQDSSNLIFSADVSADINLWSNRNIEAMIPVGAVSGGVFVNKRLQTGSNCIGFHIGSFCPSNQFEPIYQDVASNSIPLTINNLFCSSGYLGQYTARDSGFPIETYNLDAQGQKLPYEQIALGTSVSDGSYLYTTGSAIINSADTQILVAPEDTPRTIYKIGSGFNNTDSGRVYKKYQFDYTKVQPAVLAMAEPAWSQSAPLSLIFTKDKKFYFGQQYHGELSVDGTILWSWWVPQIIFNDNDNTYTFHWQNIPQGLIYSSSYDWDKAYAEDGNVSALFAPAMASNGDNIFVMSHDLPGGFVVNPDNTWIDNNINQGYTFQVLDNNWNLIKEFSVLDIPEDSFYRTIGTHFFAADENYLYIKVNSIIQAIDWHKEDFAGAWDFNPEITQEYSGTYDWLNQKFWFGSLNDDVPTLDLYPPGNWAREILPVETSKHNRLYLYSRCEIFGREYCRTDEDCNACGAGNSSCIKGQCTPYIDNFSPVSGAAGSWVTLTGCYFGCETGEIYFSGIDGATNDLVYDKLGLNIEENNAACGATWNCSDNYTNQLDQVTVEVPDKNTLPNMDCPAGNCPPAGYDPNDAIDGPIKLITANGLSDTTVDLNPSGFDVNDIYGPQICSLTPNQGPRGTTVKIVGENFSDAPDVNDYVYFTPSSDPFAEPFTDSNENGQYDVNEKYADINQNNQYDTDLVSSAYSFLIKLFVNSSEDSACPAVDGWDNNNICFNVPDNAAGSGTPFNMATDLVSVFRSNISSNALNFNVDFNSCGNNIIEYSQSEQCDGNQLPALDCTDFGYGASDSCIFDCTNSCTLLVCDANNENCQPLDSLFCGNDQIDTTYDNEGNVVASEECDGPDLGGATCNSQGFSSGDLSCSNQCVFDTSQCSNEQILPQTKIETTVPNHGEDAFCRNGIVDIYFDRLIDPISLNVYDTAESYTDANGNGQYDSGEDYIDANANGQYDEGGNIIDKNIKIAACSLSGFSKNNQRGIVSNTFQYFKNIFQKLLGYNRQALAQSCSILPIDQYELDVLNANNKTIVTMIPDALLDPEQFYRVTITGGDNGIKNLAGGTLDNSNSPVSNAENYIFEFKTLGTAGDSASGICNVDWIDVLVANRPYVDPNDRIAEFRNDDLFICAGRDDCQLNTDFDQDNATAGNQHFYKAIGKSETGFSLKASYQWSKNQSLDPQQALDLYNQTETGGDTNTDPDKVQNQTGYVFVTANPLKEATAKLIVEAQAQGSYASPAQKDFLVYILLCENPWPSLTEKFPTSEIINAYNLQTYYCRDAGPPGPTGDLPAAKMLFPEVSNLNILRNANFEVGDLTNWNAISGNAFDFQPVYSDITLIRDGISSQIQGNWWLSTREKYRGEYWENIMIDPQREAATGILRSQAFLIEGDQLKFRIGGSNNPWPIGSVSGITDLTDPAINGTTSVVFATRSNPNEDFTIRAQATGNNLTTMREFTFDVSQYAGQTGIIYIYDNNANGYINFDDLRQFKQGVQIPIRY